MTGPSGVPRRRLLQFAAALRGALARQRRAQLETWGWSLVLFWMTSPLQSYLSGVDPAAPAAAAGTPLYRDGHYAVLPLAAASLLAHREAAWRLARSAWPALLFLGYAAASLLWSEDRRASLEAMAGAAPVLGTAAAMAASLRPARTAQAVLIVLALIPLASVAAAMALPRYAITQPHDLLGAATPGVWRGLYVHKNVLGHVAGLAAAALGSRRCGRLLQSPALRWSGFAAAAACLLLSRSAGGVVLAAGLSLGLAAGRPRGRWRAALFGFGAAGLCLAAAVHAVLTETLLSALGRDDTLSGRTDIWRWALDLAGRRPVAGWGLNYSASPALRMELISAFGVDHVHNAALDVLLNLGAVGLVLWAAMVAAAFRKGGCEGAAPRAARTALALIAAGWLASGLTEDMGVRTEGPMAAIGACALWGLCGVGAGRRSFRRPVWRFLSARRAPVRPPRLARTA